MKVYSWFTKINPAKADTGCFLCLEPLKKFEGIWMVKDEVWEQTGLPQRDQKLFITLHLSCCEKLLGRPLEKTDFLVTPEEGFTRATNSSRSHQ